MPQNQKHHPLRSCSLGLTHGQRCALQETWLCFQSFLLQPAEHPGDAYWTVQTLVENTLLQFQRTMPDTSIIQSPPSSANSSEFDSMLYFVRTTVLSAFLKLYMADWKNDAQMREKALFTVSQMVNEIRGIPETSFVQFSRSIGVNELRHIV